MKKKIGKYEGYLCSFDLAVVALGVVGVLVVMVVLLLSLQSSHPLLLRQRVNVCSDNETDKIEERD